MNFTSQLQTKLRQRPNDEAYTTTTFSHADHDPNSKYKEAYSLVMMELELCGGGVQYLRPTNNNSTTFSGGAFGDELRLAATGKWEATHTTFTATKTAAFGRMLAIVVLLLLLLFVTGKHPHAAKDRMIVAVGEEKQTSWACWFGRC